MKTRLPDRSIGSIPVQKPAPIFGRAAGARSPGLTPEEIRADIARMAAEALQSFEGGAASDPVQAAGGNDHAAPAAAPPARNQTLAELQARVGRRFEGKLELATQLGARQSPAVEASAASPRTPSPSSFLTVLPSPVVALGALPSEEAAARAVAKPFARREEAPASLHRNQRRAMLKFTSRELGRIARRHIDAKEPERAGVWSTEDYRRIRAAVQDTTGRAAICVLYQMGGEEAVRIAADVDPRVPRDRRRVALALAISRAPGGTLGPDIKMGFALGLFSKVMADPNNPNMERRREFRPSRRTLSSDLTWLQDRKVLRRFQVPLHAVAPVEMKEGAIYPTNRYFAPVTRRSQSMLAIARALGDVPPALRPNPSEQWTDEDAEALAELRATLQQQLNEEAGGRAPPS